MPTPGHHRTPVPVSLSHAWPSRPSARPRRPQVNAIHNTWMMHLTLCENARRFLRLSVAMIWVQWILSLFATVVAVSESSFKAGVIALTKSLAKETAIQTITPAAISRVRGRRPNLELRVSIPIRGGYKLTARKGGMAQEVFVITELEKSQLQSVLERHRP